MVIIITDCIMVILYYGVYYGDYIIRILAPKEG